MRKTDLMRNFGVTAAVALWASGSFALPTSEPEPSISPSEPASAGALPTNGPSGMAGVRGRIVLSAERLVSFGAWGWTFEVTQPGGSAKTEASGVSFGFLWNQSQVPGRAIDAINPFTTPRIAFDVFAFPNITLGGSVGYAYTSGSIRETTPTPREYTAPTNTTLVLAPRIGVVFSASDWISIWLRGGFTYSHCSSQEDASSNPNGLHSVDWSQTSLSLDPMLVITPTSHFGITVGPVVDIPIGDSVVLNDMPSALQDIHFQLSNYGITSGILGYF
jgi:hypothetical protein